MATHGVPAPSGMQQHECQCCQSAVSCLFTLSADIAHSLCSYQIGDHLAPHLALRRSEEPSVSADEALRIVKDEMHLVVARVNVAAGLLDRPRNNLTKEESAELRSQISEAHKYTLEASPLSRRVLFV